MSVVRPSFCSVCRNGCPILVEVEGGLATKVTGDPDGPIHRGYTCHRGRALPELHADEDRLLHSMVRRPDGTFAPIGVERAMDDIAARVQALVDRHGPRSIAHYAGTGMAQCAHAYPLADSLLDGIGTPMRFSANTIDQPGKQIARGLHGYWLAPPQAFNRPDVVLWIGINPLTSYTGKPFGHPADFFRDLDRRGAKLIVVDPRRTESARRATLHLQPIPGQDVAILAALLHVILEEGRGDDDFVASEVSGVEELREAVAPFTPAAVAARAGVAVDDLVAAARMFADAGRGYAVAGTGPNMGTARGTLVEYLVLALDTVCGHHLRAGDVVRTPGTLTRPPDFRAQAHGPVEAYGFGERLRVRGLADTLGGLPVAALAEEILLPGPDRVRALFVLGGNPVVALPDQLRTIDALRALDLLVVVDIRMTQTAQLAHHVIAPTMSLEVPRIRSDGPAGSYGNGYAGYTDAVAQYTPPVVERPAGSELIEEWELYWGLAARLGIALRYNPPRRSLFRDGPPSSSVGPALDMARKPTSDELFARVTARARVPLDEVRRHRHGALFPPDPPVVVGPKDPGCDERLDVGNAVMLADLAEVATEEARDEVRPFRLIVRRMHQINSSLHVPAIDRGRPYNPAFMHPQDLDRLGLADGDLVEITSDRASVTAVAGTDAALRTGLVSMAHCFGAGPEHDDRAHQIGAPANRLLSVDDVYEPYSGQPLMSNVPVSVRPC